MVYSKSWVLITFLAFLAIASALDLDGIAHYMHYDKRQSAVGTGVSTTDTPTPSSSDTPTPSSTPESSTDTPTPSSTIVSTPSSTPKSTPSATPTSDAASSTPAPSSKASTVAAPTTKTSAKQSVYTTPLVHTSVEPVTIVSTIVSGDSTLVQTQTSSRTVLSTTAFATGTSAPQSNGKTTSGMSSKTKALIGGLVGGIGGAIVLIAAGIVLWRVRNKRRVTEDDNDLMMGTGSAVGEKPANATPFQTNLEQYHNPGGRPNAAANF